MKQADYANPDLRQWLLCGALGALATGIIWAAGSWVPLHPLRQLRRFDPAELFNLAALLALAVVLAAYWKLSVKMKSPGLRRSAFGLFGVLVIVELADLSMMEEFSPLWNVVMKLLLGLALVVLIVQVWIFGKVKKNKQVKMAVLLESPDPVEGDHLQEALPANRKSVLPAWRVLGALTIVGLLFLKVLLKAGGNLPVNKVRAQWSTDLGIEGLLLGALLVSAIVFLVWFAVVKIRLRPQLGPLSSLVGLLELLFLILIGLAFGLMLWDMFQVVMKAGLDEKIISPYFEWIGETFIVWGRRFGVIVGVIWGLLTAGLFINHRRRITAK